MNVRSIKLLTGEELVTEVVAATGTGYKIRNPLVLHAMNTPQGPSLGFAPWSLITKKDEEIELLDGAVAARPAAVMDEISDSYIQQITGLVLPPTTSQLLRG